MDPRRHSDGGGGPSGEAPPSPGSAGAPRDEGRSNGQLPHNPTVLPLGQIRVTGSSNEYTEGPAVAQRSAAPRHSEPVTAAGLRTSGPPDDDGDVVQQGNGDSPSGAEDVGAGGAGAGVGTTVRIQPKRTELDLEELKPLNASPPPPQQKGLCRHWDPCDGCGRCRCAACVRPRALPSRWLCGRRCVCSPLSAVEYGTCACCVRGLFYHCSSDDEDTCADKPFSCSQARCGARWAAVSLLALLFPCLLCYLPARGCVAACQSCYDRVGRPGCRCQKP